MNMPEYYSMDCPDACKNLLDTAKIANNNVMQFWDDFKTLFVWDMLPLSFLYPIFVQWSKDVNPSGIVIGRLKFKELLIQVTEGELEYRDRGTPSKTHHHKMDQPEPLISRYNIVDFMPDYKGDDPVRKSTTPLKSEYRNVFIRI